MGEQDPTGGMVRRHTSAYTARWGSDPYTDCWPWAEAMMRWWQAEGMPGGYMAVEPGEGEADLVPAALAETLRLSMARQPHRLLAELDMDMTARELGYWVKRDSMYPRPGTPGWPAPDGPHQAVWRQVFAGGDEERCRRLQLESLFLLESLAQYTAQDPPRRAAAARYRLRNHTIIYTHVADTAPVLGIRGPVYVSDPLAYQGVGIEDLRATDPASPVS